MDIERLVAMANDIAAFFDSEPDKAVAAEAVRFHITRFWDPRMRREIIAHAHAQGGGAGLTATAKSAVAQLTNSPNQSK
jgi:formate dehydrogenase subunit delta